VLRKSITAGCNVITGIPPSVSFHILMPEYFFSYSIFYRKKQKTIVLLQNMEQVACMDSTAGKLAWLCHDTRAAGY
jgi:hypothetical protein